MSGRGRGRGRGRAPPSGGKLFLMRTAAECGYDVNNLRSLSDITGPRGLFPPMLLHSSGDNKKLGIEVADEKNNDIQQLDLQEQQSQDGGVKIENSTGNNAPSQSPSSYQSSPTATIFNGIKRSAQTLYLITKGREIHHRIKDSAFNVKTTKDVPDIIRHSDSTKPPPVTDASTVLSHCLRGRKRTAMGYFIPEELVSGQKLGLFSGIERGVGTGGDDPMSGGGRPRLGSVDNADAEEEEFNDEGSEDEGEDYVADYYASEEENNDGDNEATF